MEVGRGLRAVTAAAFTAMFAGAVALFGATLPTTQSAAVELAAGELIEISPYAPCPVVGDLEGVFGPNRMPTYLQCIVPIVDQWLSMLDPGMPHPSGYYFIPSGVIYSGSGCEPLDSGALAYCPADAAVYLGADSVWDQYSRFGDGAPPTVIAHEVTHHIQNMRGMPQDLEGRDLIPHENQADCGAGAFMAYSRNRGLMARDDIYDLAGSLINAAESEGPGRVHGTVAERLNAFDLSYVSNLPMPLQACNAFVPSTPLI